jgi:hypothetical protein
VIIALKVNISALSEFEITHLGINTPPPSPSSCSSSSFLFFISFVSFVLPPSGVLSKLLSSFLTHILPWSYPSLDFDLGLCIALQFFLLLLHTLLWSYPSLALILVCVFTPVLLPQFFFHSSSSTILLSQFFFQSFLCLCFCCYKSNCSNDGNISYLIPISSIWIDLR